MNVLLTGAHQRKLLKKWAPILEAGERIESTETKAVLAQVLENTMNRSIMSSRTGLLGEAVATNTKGATSRDSILGKEPVPGGGFMKGAPGYTGPGQDANFYTTNIVLPMLRRVFPDLIANELVSVQPLNGPTGLALAYRPVYNKNGWVGDGRDPMGEEIGYYPVDAGYTGISADYTKDVEAESEEDKAWKAYLGENKQFMGTGRDVRDAEFASMVDGTYPTVTFGFITEQVKAQTRKLGAHWSPELAEDLQATQGMDVNQEMVNLLSYELGAEIDRQIITEMVKAAITGGMITHWDPSRADGNDQMQRLATLFTKITIEANNIAIRTKRGAANFVVTSPKICSLLQQMTVNKFVSMSTGGSIPGVPNTGVGAIQKEGLINDGKQLLVRDAYSRGDYILLGYKGAQKGDSGVIYCPYIPIQLSEDLYPGTFTKMIGARTRYGVLNHPWDSKNFYTMITVENIYREFAGVTGERTFIDEATDVVHMKVPANVPAEGYDATPPYPTAAEGTLHANAKLAPVAKDLD